MKTIKIRDLCYFLPKSSIKAGEGSKEGKYPFFTSSDKQSLWIDEYLYDDECLIIGTGGTASCSYCNGKFSASTDNFIVGSHVINVKFLYYFLRFDNLSKLQQGFHGAGLQHISKDYFGNIDVIVPDKEEQKRIVEILDEIMLSIKYDNEMLGQLNELVQSKFNEMFGEDILLNRRLCKFSDICTSYIGLTYKPENVSNEGTIVLRSGNIQNGELYLEDDVVRVNNITIKDDKIVKPLDIIMCSRNGSARLVGKTCIIKRVDEKMSFGAFMAVIKTKYPYILNSFMNSDYFRSQLVSTQTASVNQITTRMLYSYDVFKPTIDEEARFSKFVTLVDEAKEAIRERISLARELLDKKMNEFFGI